MGTLFAVDHVQNLVLQDAMERIYNNNSNSNTDDTNTVEEMPLGLYLVRGDNVCLVSGDFDATKWNTTTQNNNQASAAAAAAAAAPPLPVIHQQEQY